MDLTLTLLGKDFRSIKFMRKLNRYGRSEFTISKTDQRVAICRFEFL